MVEREGGTLRTSEGKTKSKKEGSRTSTLELKSVGELGVKAHQVYQTITN